MNMKESTIHVSSFAFSLLDQIYSESSSILWDRNVTILLLSKELIALIDSLHVGVIGVCVKEFFFLRRKGLNHRQLHINDNKQTVKATVYLVTVTVCFFSQTVDFIITTPHMLAMLSHRDINYICKSDYYNLCFECDIKS